MTSLLRRFFILFISILTLSAQEDEGATGLKAQFVRPIVIAAGATGFTDTIPVCDSQYMHISLYLPNNTFIPALTSPTGETFPWNANATNYNCTDLSFQPDEAGPVLGHIYHFFIPTPSGGNWTLQVYASSPVASLWKGIVNADFVSNLQAGLFLDAGDIALGKNVTASMIVMSGNTVITNYTYTAKWVHPASGSSQDVAFSPVVNPSTDNSTLVSTFTPGIEGDYILQVVITGSTPAGPFERHVLCPLTVHQKMISILDAITQRIEIKFP